MTIVIFIKDAHAGLLTGGKISSGVTVQSAVDMEKSLEPPVQGFPVPYRNFHECSTASLSLHKNNEEDAEKYLNIQ